MGKFSGTTRKYFDTKDATVHIGTASGSFSFETEGHGVVRAELKVNAVSGTLTVTSKDGPEAGTCQNTLTNSFSAASASGAQRKVNACDAFVDYAWALAAPATRIGEVKAGTGNTSTGTISASGSMSDSDANAYAVEVTCTGAGNVGSRVGSAVAGSGNTTSTTVTVTGTLGANDVSAHTVVLKVADAGDTSETSVPIDITIDGVAQEQGTLSSESLSLSLTSLGLTVGFTTASFVKDDTWTIDVAACPVLAVAVNREEPSAVTVKSNGQTAAIGESGVSLAFASGNYVKDDTWTLDLKGISVDADLIIEAV